jgi:ABC-2 type transport system permease protein
MRVLGKLIFVQAKLFLREPAAFFFTLAFPALLLILFGAIFGNTPDPRLHSTLGYIDYEVPGLAAVIIATVAFMSIPIGVAGDREKQILRRYRATPLRPAIYLTATNCVYFGMSLLGMFILVVVAKLLFGLRFQGSWLSVLGGFTLSALAFFSVGYVVASLSPTARVAQVIGQLAFFPMMFLSGAAFPAQIMPANVRHVSEALPLTYVVRLLQGLWSGDAWGGHLTEVAVLTAMVLVGTLVSSRTFRWE